MTLTQNAERVPPGWRGLVALVVAGAVLWFVCSKYPAELPFFLPWEFSWPVFLATSLSLAWFFIGLQRLPPAQHPPLWRSTCFIAGELLLYAMVQTHIDYYAQHMFFIHRAQHFVLHHVGAFLIALGASGSVLWAGMPDFLKPLFTSKPVRMSVDFIMHPVAAPVIFVGMIYLWLIPAIHTRVMLDARLYDVMNWSMALDGIAFWWLVLDPRPSPPARIGSGIRALLIIAVEPPQMALGAILSLSGTDYYPVYRICGRMFDIPALSDQHYGGLIIWLPGTLLSLLAIILVLVNMRRNEDGAADVVG
ncbi:MAG: cytochrome c oxidase assembly protein [Alphaproteobacteria bacterium]|nr:cytochrome c oxidase assembly protein [Alphaproteobacteria bacterium]